MKKLEVIACDHDVIGTAPSLGISEQRFEELKNSIIKMSDLKSFPLRFEKYSEVCENANELAFMIYLSEKALDAANNQISKLFSMVGGLQ